MKSQTYIEISDDTYPIYNSFPILGKALMFKDDEKGSVCCLDKDNKEQFMFELGERPHYRVFYFNLKVYFSKNVNK